MIDPSELSRRRFMQLGLNVGAAAGASMLLPGLVRPARAALPGISEEEAVIAFGHVGPITDEGWTWSHHQGLEAVKAAYPKAKYLEVESIPYSADATRTFRQFVSEGANILFSTSNYGDFFYDVANRAPDTAFLECDGRTLGDNLGWYYVAHWWPTFVVGVAAGALSKTGKLGYVASFPVPSVYSSTNAFLMGARTVNPNATLQAITINSWFDPQAATQAGTALIDNGCDFLFGIMDEAGYLQVAEQRGVWAAMWNTDIRRYGPSAYVSSIIVDFKQYYVEQVKARLEGKWAPAGTILKMGAGVDRDAWGAKVPADVAAKADAVRKDILDGKFNPFTGPIKDSTGAVRVKEGEAVDDAWLYNWDWSIEGVTGVGS